MANGVRILLKSVRRIKGDAKKVTVNFGDEFVKIQENI
jgi:hypothetical protein